MGSSQVQKLQQQPWLLNWLQLDSRIYYLQLTINDKSNKKVLTWPNYLIACLRAVLSDAILMDYEHTFLKSCCHRGCAPSAVLVHYYFHESANHKVLTRASRGILICACSLGWIWFCRLYFSKHHQAYVENLFCAFLNQTLHVNFSKLHQTKVWEFCYWAHSQLAWQFQSLPRVHTSDRCVLCFCTSTRSYPCYFPERTRQSRLVKLHYF